MTDKTSRSTYDERVSSEQVPVTVTAADFTTSDEAMKVLTEQGVEAWQAWCTEHQPTA